MELTRSHAATMADIHDRSFRNFFLTSLGRRFLSSFYAAIITSEEGCSNGIFVEGTLAGFAVGTTNVSGFYSRLLKSHMVSMGMAALPVLLLKPSKIFSLLSSLRKSGYDQRGKSAALLSICINPDFQGHGLGKSLLAEFEKLLKQRGSEQLVLTTDANDNDTANHFYLRCGYKLVKTMMGNKGRLMNLYQKQL